MSEIKNKKVKKLTLKGYYDQKLSELSFVERVAIECKVTTRQVYNWLSGDTPVPPLSQEKINSIAGQELDYEQN